MNKYFSDRENGPRARTDQTISPTVWRGLVGLVQSLIESGAFGYRFPKSCPDSHDTCGVDLEALRCAVQAEMPGLEWPLQTTYIPDGDFTSQPYAPPVLLVLDFLEFAHRSIGRPQPIPGTYHEFFKHHHLAFDVAGGQAGFRDDVNRIFARNGVAYEFIQAGQIQRTLPPVLDESLRNTTFRTGDNLLDGMLEEARIKFTNRDPVIRREGMERLWDAWERLKTMAHIDDKKQSITIILDRAASEMNFRQLLENEAKLLTDVGNSHLIRHSELKQIPVVDADHVDYLFHRLFAMIQLLIRKNVPS